MGTVSDKKQTEILIIFRADLTARGILRLPHFAVFFEFRQRSGRELHIALLGYLQNVSLRYAGVSTR